MPFLLLIAGAILAIAAFNNSQGTLATELETDVPAYLKWGLAVGAVGALGWIPGMSTISRYLVALVMVVLVVTQWSNIQAGFQNFFNYFGSGASGQASAASATPASQYAANPANPQITAAAVSGTGTIPTSSSAYAGNVNAAGQLQTVTSPYGAYDPGMFLAAFEAGFGGFGGVV